MKFEYLTHPTFPKLGYVAKVEPTRVEVKHGLWVETHDNWFSDGAWDGDCLEPPEEKDFLLGSAVRANYDRCLTVLTSQSPIDRLFVVAMEDGAVRFSNSLPLLLMELDDSLDPQWPYYRSVFMAAELGVNMTQRQIPTKRGFQVQVVLNCSVSLTVATSGQEIVVDIEPRAPEPPFRSYEHYRSTLARVVKSVVGNAEDARRQHPFSPIPSISAGYDSSVIAVLAAEAGCKRALTLLRYTDDGEELVDYPGEVASTVGLELIEVRRGEWKEGDGDVEQAALIAATSTTFMDVVMLAYEPHLPSKLLIVGYAGDNVWDANNFRCYRDIVQSAGPISGRSLAEHRLAHGYVIFPVPFIGHTAHPSIFNITNSPEMAEWNIGGSYNRPIARRIVEEAGVRRGSFATKKYAGSARVGSSRTSYSGRSKAERSDELSEIMGIAPIESFLAFVDAQRLDSKSIGRRVKVALRFGSLGHFFFAKLEALNHRFGSRMHRWGLKAVVPRRVMAWFASRVKITPDYTYLFPHWGSEILKEQYRPPSSPNTVQ